MIVIRDQQLRLLMLAQLVRELQQASRSKTPPPHGFTEAQAEELAALSTAELVKLSEMTEPRVAVQIDAGSLEHGLRQVDYLTKRSRQLEYFIVNGATSNMLTKLFRISSADVTLKRRLFSGTASSLRRPSMPPPRYPTVIGEMGSPFGAIFEIPPPNEAQIVDCAPARKLSSAHMLPSPSMAMPPSEFIPPPA